MIFGLDLGTWAVILFMISEALAFIPAVKSNGVFQLIFNLLSSITEAIKNNAAGKTAPVEPK